MKRVLTLLFLALALTMPALAAGGPDTGQPLPIVSAQTAPVLYPSEVREVQAGDFRRIEKVYLLDGGDDPAAIPTASFEREGYHYTLLDLLREDRTETENREHTETVTRPSDTQDMGTILARLDAVLPYTDEDGFNGALALDPKSITVEAAGYKTSTKTITASRTYPGLSDADASLVPETIQDGGRTLELSNVSWQAVPGGNEALSATYTATASYTGTASSKYATGYTVTASYPGELTRTVSGALVYTAVFTGEPTAPTVQEPHAEPHAETPAGAVLHYGLPALLLAAMLVMAGLGIYHFIKRHKNRRYSA